MVGADTVLLGERVRWTMSLRKVDFRSKVIDASADRAANLEIAIRVIDAVDGLPADTMSRRSPVRALATIALAGAVRLARMRRTSAFAT